MKKFLFVSALIVFSMGAQALAPPIPQEELQATAELIVKGEVTKVECLSQKAKVYECGKEVQYRATVTVEKVIKKLKEMPHPAMISFNFSHIKYNRGCVGDQDHFAAPEEKGIYFLRQGPAGWGLLNWSAAQVEKAGDVSKIPSCPKGK